jgi:peptide subunit release factor 1 (eRF1)
MNSNNWRFLLSHSIRPNRAVLSVYLNVDQTLQVNLNRGFETQFDNMMETLQKTIRDPAESERFRIAKHHVADFVHSYPIGARTLAMFFDESVGFFWHQEIGISMQNQARWSREFYLKPLAGITDDFERYGIALVDRANARLFTVSLGVIEEVVWEGFDASKVRHIKTVGTDRLASAGRVQRKADEQTRKNLRLVVRELNRMVQANRIDRLLLAGIPELTSQLQEFMPKRLALRVIGAFELSIDASLSEALELSLPLTEKYERSGEEQIVSEVTTSAKKAGRAVVGLASVLKMINEARVWQLIYSEDFHVPGFECPNCASLYSIERPTCMYCDASLMHVPDVVERAVERALRKEARIEIVRGEAAAALDSAGGIGAFLKARRSIAV